ncbi:MAG: hypothetical protein K2V38_23555, partial [Gemmataceae bacterium]|nr:hypothetical protein [Gemmataceae bacterium]
MPKTKTKMPKSKKTRYDEDEDDDALEPVPEPEPGPAPAEVRERRADAGMVLDLEGYGGAVASALVVNGLRAYLSVVNKGVNVVAANRAHTAFVPV